jgi:hypothetical protein
MVNGLPFFDHASLLTLRHSSPWWRSTRSHQFPVFGLRLLDASGCTNATSTGLAEALPHFPDLASLDLSRTPAAKDDIVLSRLQYLRNLRVLNLAGLGLKDAEFSIIAPAIGARVRSLDVSDNCLTDVSARLLLEHCLKETVVSAHITRTRLSPIDFDPPNNHLDSFESEDLVSHLRKMLTKGFVGSLAIEEARDVGITHLYLSKNSVTIEGVSGLLRSRRLRVLDIGVLPAVLQSPVHYLPEDVVELPGVAKMTPVLSEYASAKLEYLRINYEIITENAPVMTVSSPRAELSGDFGCYAPANALELDANEASTYELDSVATNVVELHGESSNLFELQGDSPYRVELPGSSPSQETEDRLPAHGRGAKALTSDSFSTPKIQVTPEDPTIRRGAAYAPEPVFLDSSISPLPDNENHGETSLHAIPSTSRVLSPVLSGFHDLSPSQSGTQRSRLNPLCRRSKGSA